jgi:hypothetical protein
MSTYWVTFRIEDKIVNGKDYDDRYDPLIAKLRGMGRYWDIPTSYVAFETDRDIDPLVRYFTQSLSADHDVFLICEIGVKSARIWGANPDDDIFTLMPYLKKA